MKLRSYSYYGENIMNKTLWKQVHKIKMRSNNWNTQVRTQDQLAYDLEVYKLIRSKK